MFSQAGDHLRAIATIVGGLIPVNLYMGQSLSNEPMAACTSGLVILLTLRLVCFPISNRMEPFTAIGCALGLVILTKVSRDHPDCPGADPY